MSFSPSRRGAKMDFLTWLAQTEPGRAEPTPEERAKFEAWLARTERPVPTPEERAKFEAWSDVASVFVDPLVTDDDLPGDAAPVESASEWRLIAERERFAPTIIIRAPGTHLRARQRRGGGRPGHRRTVGTRAGPDDPGDAESDEPKRRCAAPWCDHPVYGPPHKRYCGTERCNRARAEERQRDHRATPDETERARVVDARLAGYLTFAGPADLSAYPLGEHHSQSFVWKFGLADDTDPGEHEALILTRTCRCNGHHIDGGVVGCVKCGHPRPRVPA